MKSYIEKMDESYRNKHYPQGSFFEKAAGANKRGNITLAVMAAVVSVLLGALIFFLIGLTMDHSAQGNAESVKMGLIFIAVVAVILALCVFGFIVAVRHMKDGAEEVMKKAAKNSGLTEDDIREFERQALQSDSYVLTLAGKISAAMSGQKDGLLTRDYIWLGDNRNCILKRGGIVGASLYHWYYYVNKKRVCSLNLALVNRDNVMAGAEVTEEAGRELMKLLSEAHPAIQVHEDILEEGKEFDAWRESLVTVKC